MVEQHTQEKLNDGYQSLLFEYAAGLLDEAQNLIVATHLSLSPKGRQLVHSCEAIGGAILERECTPAEMRQSSLQNVLDRLDDAPRTPEPPKPSNYPQGFAVPSPLHSVMTRQKRAPQWKNMMPGIQTFTLDVDCKTSAVRFLNVGAAQTTPHHSHAGTEITLVLNGAFSDETGEYRTGDLIVTDEDIHHTPTACPDMGCVCMVVSTAPIRLKGFASLLNPFLSR